MPKRGLSALPRVGRKKLPPGYGQRRQIPLLCAPFTFLDLAFRQADNPPAQGGDGGGGPILHAEFREEEVQRPLATGRAIAAQRAAASR